jgi:hypothetical protein
MHHSTAGRSFPLAPSEEERAGGGKQREDRFVGHALAIQIRPDLADGSAPASQRRKRKMTLFFFSN